MNAYRTPGELMRDWAHADRQQLLNMERIKDELREEDTGRMEMVAFSLLLGFCAALVGVVVTLVSLGVIA